MIPDITIAGMGVSAVVQVTSQTEQRIRQCNEALFLDAGVGTAAFLQARCPRVTPLYGLYQEGGSRRETYHRQTATVIEAALCRRPVIYLTHGHPMVFSYASTLIRDVAQALDLRVEVLPGISSMAALMADLWLDPATHGLQMFEATDILLRRRPLQPDVPALIWQVGNLETILYTTKNSGSDRLLRFRDWLLHFYPADHPITAYHAAPHPITVHQQWQFPLRALPEQAERLHPAITLFVPPCATRPIQDFELLQRVRDRNHLKKITE